MNPPKTPYVEIVEMRVTRKPRMGEIVNVLLADGQIVELDPEVVVKNGLGTGDCFPAQRLEDLKAQHSFLMARRKLILYLQTHRKTEAEAAEYLKKQRFSKDAVAYAVNAAKELGFLNDRIYAQQFAVQRSENRRQGILLVRHELKSRGVDPDLVQAATSDVANRDTQLEQARCAATKRAATMSELDKPTKYRRLAGFLARRGYTGDVVSQVLREVLNGGTDLEADFHE